MPFNEDYVTYEDLITFSSFDEISTKSGENSPKKRLHLFMDCEKSEIEELAKSCKRQQIYPENTLSSEEAEADGIEYVYLIKNVGFAIWGKSKLAVKHIDPDFKKDKDKRKEKRYLITLRGASQVLIGEFSFAEFDVPNVEFRAINSGDIVKVPKGELKKVAEKYPLLYKRLFQITIHKMVADRRQREAISLESATISVCLAQALLNMYKEFGGKDNYIEGFGDGKLINGVIEPQVLGHYISETEGRVTTKLKKLLKEKYIHFNKDKHPWHYTINVDKLKNLVKNYQEKRGGDKKSAGFKKKYKPKR